MAKTLIKGRDVGFFVEKTAGSGVYARIGCVGDVSLDIDTESDEVSCVDSGDWAESEPGIHSFSGSASLTARQLTDTAAVTGPPAVPASTDATDGVSMENLIDFQIAKRKILMRVTLGLGTGAARYGGVIYLNKTGIKGQVKGVATGSISFTGTGPLVKTLTPAV